MRHYFVYVLVTENNKVMYIGVSNDMERRQYEHAHKLNRGFTWKYNVGKLVYYETYGDIREAIAREKQLKGWRREKKNALVETVNPEWKDLAAEWDIVIPNAVRDLPRLGTEARDPSLRSG